VNAPEILLFADGGPGVGAGHMYRLYPVFRSLRELGVPAQMWAPLANAALARLGLHDIQSAPDDIKTMIAELSRPAPTIVVLDTYRHLPELCEAFGEQGCSITIFDDHFRVTSKVALIVNSSPAVKAGDYASGLTEKILLGPAYASIACGFAEARSRYMVSKSISSILIALGGVDASGNLPDLLGTTLPLLETPVEICVLGLRPFALDVPKHVTLNWEWLQQDALAQRLADFDLAILAGGTMLWQTACVGVPTISWPQTTGQEGHAAAWENQGAIVVIKGLEDLPAVLVRLESQHLRMQISRAGRELVDGLGAGRIASCLASMLEHLPCV